MIHIVIDASGAFFRLPWGGWQFLPRTIVEFLNLDAMRAAGACVRDYRPALMPDNQHREMVLGMA